MLVFLGTGCRLGEICNLQWRDVDIVQGTIVK
ncbi:site-specific integrase [Bacillus wiedmannii]